ncbi:protein of unknown function [Shewanella benthica]|uniref:Uncharacterized protein n=1 Tax=Shewanella benthica TaxID=43661 RepID=A0A330LWG5_9GAMM|nr:protein of unknown function [Shewanella benthica]
MPLSAKASVKAVEVEISQDTVSSLGLKPDTTKLDMLLRFYPR